MIGNIDKIISAKDYLIIVDRKNAKGVFIFNDKGKFLQKIQNHGNVPGEFTKVTDVWFNKYSNQIEIYDSLRSSILIYDLLGEFVSEVKNPINCQRFIPITKSERYFYSKFIPNRYGLHTDENYRLVKGNNNGQVIDYYLPFKNENMYKTNIVNAFNNFFPIEDTNKILFIETYNNNIYELKENSISIKYKIDFINHNIPETIFQSDIENKVKYISENNFAYMNNILFEDEEELIFHYTHDKHIKEFVFNKRNSESFHYLCNYIENDNIYCRNSMYITKQFSYSIIEPLELLTLENVDDLSPRIQKMIKNIGETNNPIIVKIKKRL